jgi:hypothetical protein
VDACRVEARAQGSDGGHRTDERDFARGAGIAHPVRVAAGVGKLVTFHFCPECGSTVFWEPERMPNLIGVAVGAFGDPSFPQPEQSVFTTSKHAWIGLPREMHAFATMPSTESPRD